MSGVRGGGDRSRHRRSLAFYRHLLRLHPRAFRERFAQQMEEDVVELLDDEERSGKWALARAWFRILRDVAVSVLREWRAAAGWADGLAPASGDAEAPFPPPGRSVERGLGRWVRATARDARVGLRSLGRQPGFAAAAIGVLAVGIGGTTTVFSTVNAYLLRGLPFPDQDRLMSVDPVTPVAWDEVGDLFEVPVSWDLDDFTLYGDEGPELVEGAWVTPGFFEAYGIRPVLGRAIRPEEGGEGGASVAVISWDLWQQRFGGDPGVLGRTVSAAASDRPAEEETFTIVGVLPKDFWFVNRYTRFLAPLRVSRPLYVGRLRSGVTRERAEAELTARARAASEDLPPDVRVRLTPLLDSHVAGVRPTLLALMASVLLVLLIACANVAVLLLVRSARREREFGVRRALGAGSGAIARKLLVEGVVLALVAGGIGVVLAWIGTGLLAEPIQSRLGISVPGGADSLRVDPTVLLLALSVCGATGFAFGLVPLLGGLTGGPGEAVRAGGRTGTGSRGRRRLQSGLVALEVALSTALLVAAGLTIRSTRSLEAVDLGFTADRVTKARVQLRARSYPEPTQRAAFFEALRTSMERLPEVEAAGLVLRAPLTWSFGSAPVAAEPERGEAVRQGSAMGTIVTAGYFEAMGIRILRGRDFGPGDEGGALEVAVVSQSLAGALWPHRDPLGRRFREVARLGADPASEPEPWRTVVGVVNDVTTSVESDSPAEYYVPYAQLAASSMELMVRTRPETGSVVPAIEDAVRALDPRVPVHAVVRMSDAVEDALAPARFVSRVLAGFSLFALVLACLALYGGVAYAVAGRRREIAIRMSVGASRRAVVRLFLRDGVAVALVGVVVGVLASSGLGRLLASTLHGVDSGDLATRAAAAVTLVAVALLATWIPAHRASRTDPMGVLREE